MAQWMAYLFHGSMNRRLEESTGSFGRRAARYWTRLSGSGSVVQVLSCLNSLLHRACSRTFAIAGYRDERAWLGEFVSFRLGDDTCNCADGSQNVTAFDP